ncbi:dGTPase [Pseudomonas oryzihabitans]|uniref:dGTPase n=1 Tax=Pseudomonas oryzihabitans TaxID=47885 RepID=UPI00111EAD9C|nr:dGTPase [Pseudomonas psychrotolerans]QDD90248.1 dGTPase [Pseudomonas psychrotolerans]
MSIRDKISGARAYRRQATDPSMKVDDCGIAWVQTALESDRGRIIVSAPVRRLQQKTQVFPLERNAAVRSRLTHSLEVQQTGRYIVRKLFKELGPRAAEYGLQGLDGILETLVEMSCLMHDIGNPPFGHFGEFALNAWSERHLAALFEATVPAPHDPALRERLLSDLAQFEGNAQAVRLVVKLLRLNLTYTQTAGLLKYVRPAYQPKPARGEPGYYLNKKPGYYLAEEPFVQELWQVLDMAPGTRHPVVYIMEAADDISYCLADLEDAVEKGILSLERLSELLIAKFGQLRPHGVDEPVTVIRDTPSSFAEAIRSNLRIAQREEVDPQGSYFIWLRVNMLHPLVAHAASQFIEHFPAVEAGTLGRALLEDGSIHEAVVNTFKQVAVEQVFCHREVQTLELQGLRILQGLLDSYAPLLRLPAADFIVLSRGERGQWPHEHLLLRRLPPKHLRAYTQALRELDPAAAHFAHWEFYHRYRMLLDFVSGMTDQFALDEYQTLSAT